MILALSLSTDTRIHILNMLKKYFSIEQVILLIVFIWYLLSTYLNGRRAGDTDLYFRIQDWKIFDTLLCMLVIFPLPRLIGSMRTKQVVEMIIHVVVISYSVFTIFCLWHIFHLEVLDLPSGEQAGMTVSTQLVLGYHPNPTGMISATLFCLCVYMIVSQGVFLKLLYLILGFFQLLVIYLSNSRAPFLAVVVFLGLTAFWLMWKLCASKTLFIRAMISLLVSIITVLFFWKARSWVFLAFENITHFQDSLVSDLATATKKYVPKNLTSSVSAHLHPLESSYNEDKTRQFNSLSDRGHIWMTCMHIMSANTFNFFFGVNPIAIPDAISTYGKFSHAIAHAHNSIFQIGVGIGVPAMAAYIVFLLLLAFRSMSVLIKSDKKNIYVVVLPGTLLCFILINLAEAYLFAFFSVISCFFYLICGWVLEEDEFQETGAKKKVKKIRFFSSFVIYTMIVLSFLIYTDRYIHLNPNRISGRGTREEPYLLEDKADLCYFRDLVNHGNYFDGSFFLQSVDIDLEGLDWRPIGTWGTPYYFAGIYDGGCHVINNLVITRAQTNRQNDGRVGFFGHLQGTVINLGIESGVIEGNRCASIAGLSKAGAAIINCYNKADVKGTSSAGGICDHFNDCYLINCLNEGRYEAPNSADLVSGNAKLVCGKESEDNFTYQFQGTFIPLQMNGDTVEERLNSGLIELIEMGILKSQNVRFWQPE